MPDAPHQSTELTRRGLLGTAAAVGAAATLPAGTAAAAAPATAARTRRVDVVVVGAGLAGLTAARALVKRGRSVAVLEARARVGGRTLNASLGGGKVVEVGGQWIGPGQDRILALSKAVGVKTFKTYDQGTQTFEFQGTRTNFTGPIPPLPGSQASEFLNVLVELETLAKQVPLDKPWTAAKADEWDGMTLESYKRSRLTGEGSRFLLDLLCNSVFTVPPSDISFLHFLFYGHAGGGFIKLASTGGGAQESRFVGGSQLVSLKVAAKLGSRVVLKAPVRSIEQAGSRVRVTSDRGTWLARRVIVAIPPTLAGRIAYDPIMPALRDQLTQRMPMGSVIKCEAVYDEPFWRKDGRSGYTNSDTGVVQLTYDNSPPGGTPGVLLGFVTGTAAREQGARSHSARRASVLADFKRLFGEKAASPVRFIEHDWSTEEWTRGCYGAFLPPGVWTGYGRALRAPVGRIHWAGTETAQEGNGYMDGAVRSGERAAAEALAKL